MGREKEGFRDVMAQLNEAFPDVGALNRGQVAKFMGWDVKTVGRRGIRFSTTTGKVTKADLARQICL